MVKFTLPERHPGFYPEKDWSNELYLRPSTLGYIGKRLFHSYHKTALFTELVKRRQEIFATMAEGELRALADDLRRRLYHHAPDHEIAAEVFALVREQATRILRQRHFDVQLAGGWIMLNGMVAEMATGEGKTLTATLPACFAALSGIPVHIITANDYLARRDAEFMRPLYAALNITVGAIEATMTGVERKKVYGLDIVYCANKEIVFDYLKDRLMFSRQPPGTINLPLRRLCGKTDFESSLRLRGLHYAIVDEADCIFIDEARTPLILSQSGDCGLAPEIYQTILAGATGLAEHQDFTLSRTDKTVTLTAQGSRAVAELPTTAPALSPHRRTLEFLTRKALAALHLFTNGREYIVAHDKIAIIGEQTGRIMPGRSWEMGLQQFIESKEGCPITGQAETLTKINSQTFFNKYLQLSGMTGTAREVRRELWDVYRLHVVTVPTNVTLQSRDLGCQLFATAAEKNQAILERITALKKEKRPILIGTASVGTSENLVHLLQSQGLLCTLLNARQDKEEADIIARAGTAGQITVATNMAGRGTDILLAPGVAERGGLHVLASECANPRRIDRQLFGRGGRQGDPGSFEALFCLEDPLFRRENLPPLAILLLICHRYLRLTRGPLTKLLITRVQKNVDRKQYLARRQLLEQDSLHEQTLAFNRYGA